MWSTRTIRNDKMTSKPVTMESRRKRVEQKGRFTITEIIPGSPYSSNVSSPTFLDDEVFDMGNDAPMFSNSCDGVQHVKSMACNDTIKLVSNGFMELKVKEMSNNQTQQSTEAAVVSIEANCLILAPDAHAIAMDTSSAALVAGSPSRKYSSPKKSRDGGQRARRVKRRGRFTIIEMAFDSPSSRKDSDELDDHRLTSAEGSSVASLPQPLSRNLDAMERRTKPKRATRSMPRMRQTSSMRRLRRRSESPACEFVESVDASGIQQHQQDVTACTELEALSVTERTEALGNVARTMAVGTGAAATPRANVPVPKTDRMNLDSEETIAGTTSAFLSATPSSHQTNGSVVGQPQSSSMSISSAQFLQQQQTIASLIRQQYDLKQIIGVLQEQQQQLMSIPSQINELTSQNESLSNSLSKDDETRELCMKVKSLSLTNESLHSMLNDAEREVRHRKMQIECLSEENDELRQRCGQLELYLQPRD